MAELKTKPTDADVASFIAGLTDELQRKDAETIRILMEEATGAPAKMWGSSIVGFDTYHYVYKSGREGDWMVTGFAPRKNQLTIYIMDGFSDYKDLLSKLGKHKTSKGCLYIRKLADTDVSVLRELVTRSAAHVRSGDFLL